MASFLSTVAALESSNFRETLGLPAKEQLAGPEAFTLALQTLGVVRAFGRDGGGVLLEAAIESVERL